MKVLTYLLIIWPHFLFAQERGQISDPVSRVINGSDGMRIERDLRFVFYNVENLFDPFDDSLIFDEEFLPYGERGWTWDRFLVKEQRILKALAAAGGWNPPGIIGICEVENRFVLNWLTRKTPLLKYNYRIIHQDSPDERGIDVAMLYQPDKFRPVGWEYLRVGYHMETDADPDNAVRDPGNPTRDILYVKGLIMGRDTIHLVICHWPSRWEGYLESLPARLMAAGTLRHLVDSVLACDTNARILVAGDLNDELSDPSLSEVLRVRDPSMGVEDTCLYHTGSKGLSSGIPGTLKYRGRWYEFDHIFVSGAFLNDSNLFVRPGGKRVFAPGFLLENDPVLPGKRPFRTYNGYKYSGGFSDHLPVYIDLWQK